MDYKIRTMELNELKDIYLRITQDFPEGEYPPYNKLYTQLENQIQKGWILVYKGVDVAYSICAEGKTNNYVLISFFAVYREYRGKGTGSIFLDRLMKQFKDANGIIVEVEKIEAAIDDEDRKIRQKRIEFYQKAGFRLVPGIDYIIWDVPMHLMVMSCKTTEQRINDNIGEIIYDIYYALLGKHFIKKLEFRRFKV